MPDTPEVKPIEAIVIMPSAESIALRPIMNLQFAKQQLAELQAFIDEYLVEGEDYGVIPGTEKKDKNGNDVSKRCLFKSGAEKLCDVYGMSDDYEKVKTVELWESVPPLFHYEFKCILKSRRDEKFLGAGYGSCNSYESKYRWRESKRKCPLCQQETIIKGKEEYGGGFLCWAKRGGCGAKFLETDEAITGQKVGKEPNEDIADVMNTVLKMAKKRAKVDAVIAVTRSSGIFTQDLEEGESPDTGQGTRAAAQKVAQDKIAEAAKKAPQNGSNKQEMPSDGPPQLVCYPCGPQAPDHYEVTGDPDVMQQHKALLLLYGKRKGREPIVVMDSNSLDSFKFQFEKERGGIMTSLKGR